MKKEITILDGAMGTELERRGYRTRLPLWSASALTEVPQLVQQIHEEYLLGGADLVTANTFRTTFYTYRNVGLSDDQVQDDLVRALELARQAMQNTGITKPILASITSLEDCYRPDLTPDLHILKEYHSIQIEAIRKAGYQTVLIETMHTTKEAVVIVEKCYEHQLEFMVSFITEGPGELLSGDSLSEAIESLSRYKPAAILLNCRPAAQLHLQIPYLMKFAGKTGVYPNGSGSPDDTFGWKFDHIHPEHEFVAQAKQWIEKGIDIIGGCCGTRPEDIKALREYLNEDVTRM